MTEAGSLPLTARRRGRPARPETPRRAATRLRAAGQVEPIRPALAIDALLAAMRARFGIPDSAANQLLRPALADWRDAVGCADPLFVAANAQGSGAEKALVPIPMPSWCAWLVDAGVMMLDGQAHLEGRAWCRKHGLRWCVRRS